MGKQVPRKVVVIDAKTHANIKRTSREFGMTVNALASRILAAWHKGKRFVPPRPDDDL